MTQPVPQASFTQALLVNLAETFERVSYGIFLDKGTSLFETLETVSSTMASRPVSADCASLAAQVEHICFFIDQLIDYVQHGNPAERPDWGAVWRTREAVTPEEWNALQTRLRETYKRLTDMIQSGEDWNGENRMSGAIGIVAHSAYHLGEIRQALCTLRDTE